jgi:hypothetical protein
MLGPWFTCTSCLPAKPALVIASLARRTHGRLLPTPLYTLLLPLPCRPVGIVQQNQIKKARKIQDDIRAEHERLVVGHLSRLRRAAAAELQADSAAKQVTMAWLQVCTS